MPRRAFTLIELLVVLSIIALLIGIIVPTLSQARTSAKVTMCATSIRQIGIGIHAYAQDFRYAIPRGPSVNNAFGQPHDQFASSQIWLGASGEYNAHGPILDGYIDDKRAVFCPGDDTTDPTQELARIGSPANDAYSSYLYRSLDDTTRDTIENLGNNALGNKARALALDSNALITLFPDSYRTNHGNKKVSVLYLDTHAKSVDNPNDIFTIRDGDVADFEGRLNQILQNADYVENGDVGGVPHP